MTDMTLLRALIGTKRLTASNEKAFKDMLQDMVDGRLVQLSRKQREWANKIFTDLGLHGKELKLSAAPTARKQVGAPPTVFEMPKPLKPPGRA